MLSVALVSPLRSIEKHPANPIAHAQRFLNFGILSLATYIRNQGNDCRVFDEYCLDGRSAIDQLEATYGPSGPQAIGISCISAYSADRSAQLLREMKARWPSTPLVIGGQHFVGFWGESFAKAMPDADILVAGEAEASFKIVLQHLERGDLGTWDATLIPSNVFWRVGEATRRGRGRVPNPVAMDDLVDVDYDLYSGSDGLFPSLEFSRGCAHACVFCANSTENRRSFRRASADRLGGALRHLSSRRRTPLSFYLQASNFVVTLPEAIEIKNTFAGVPAEWRTEIRVDEIESNVFPVLREAGLRIIDVGLESASEATLRAMNKTKDPASYLSKAAVSLSAATSAGIFTKVNFLIHPGDTHRTVGESRAWLLKNSENIGAVSSSVALEYPGTPLAKSIAHFETRFGTRREEHPLSRWGVYQLSPSSDLDCSNATRLAHDISHEMQTRANFARSKSFGYLPAGVTVDRLLKNLPEADHSTPYSGDE